MSDEQQRTPEKEVHRIYCPRETCDCGKGGGRWLCTIRFPRGNRCEVTAICPNKKSRELNFTFNA
jgi:hypothetical protein